MRYATFDRARVTPSLRARLVWQLAAGPDRSSSHGDHLSLQLARRPPHPPKTRAAKHLQRLLYTDVCSIPCGVSARFLPTTSTAMLAVTVAGIKCALSYLEGRACKWNTHHAACDKTAKKELKKNIYIHIWSKSCSKNLLLVPCYIKCLQWHSQKRCHIRLSAWCSVPSSPPQK